MKPSRLSAALSASVLFACLSLVAVCPQQAAAEPQISGTGETYITTNTTTKGAFSSRGVITFNADHTLLAVDSGEGGPKFFFSSQTGIWGVGSGGTLVGRTIEFVFSPASDLLRLDFTFKFGDKDSLSGTVAFDTFPLKADPLGEGGKLLQTLNFTGDKVPLPN